MVNAVSPETASDAIPKFGQASVWSKAKYRLALRLVHGRFADNQAWHRAVETNNIAMADALIAHGVKPDEGEGAWDPKADMLFDCLRFKGGQMAKRLLAIGADPNHIHHNNYWDAPTHRAARFGNLEALTAMLEAGADPDLRDGNEFTPALAALSTFGMGRLHNGDPAARVEERWAMVEACLAAGADVKAQASHGQDLVSFALEDTPARLRWALGLGLTLPHPQMALEDTLFSDLVKLESGDNYIRSDGLALARAREDKRFVWDRWGLVEIILEQGARFDAVNAEGRTLLEEGLRRKALRPQDVAELVRRGAPLDVRDAQGNTLTHQLFTSREHANEKGVALYEALRDAGLPDQTEVTNAAGQTPMEALTAGVLSWTVREASVFVDHLAPTPATEAPVQRRYLKVPRPTSPG